MKDYGKHVKWPSPPKVLRRFEEALQAIYHRLESKANGSLFVLRRPPWLVPEFRCCMQRGLDIAATEQNLPLLNIYSFWSMVRVAFVRPPSMHRIPCMKVSSVTINFSIPSLVLG